MLSKKQREQYGVRGQPELDYDWGRSQERRSMSVQNDHEVSQSQAEDAWTDYGSDFVLIAEGKPRLASNWHVSGC
jgi:hypothetical protein